MKTQQLTVAFLMSAVALVLLSQVVPGAAAVLWLGSLGFTFAALTVAVRQIRDRKRS
ncbi:hypothetical protein [Streptomyces sp. HNM0574]|uniref:hypothetical protein n=1 Tax=Streptomyces sp. HNM0574 TaxID=2714954 RepID=UPI00146F0F91|nr:hypothetical protein [Streptomyces sp. HNM0574]NLU70582.1 hypothetical protein [Streptomyces sp. HNM0574]